MRAVSLFALSLLALAGCTHAASSSSSSTSTDEPSASAAMTPQPTTAAASRTTGREIFAVVTRDQKVTVHGGRSDLRVVIRKTDGSLVSDGMTLAELRANDPDLHQIVTSAMAANGLAAPPTGTYVDGRLDYPIGSSRFLTAD